MSDTVDLMHFPDYLAVQLGIPVFVAGLLACAILLILFVLPVVFACSKFKKDGFWLTLFTGLMILSGCVGLGWVPVWTFAVLCMLIALMLGSKVKDLI